MQPSTYLGPSFQVCIRPQHFLGLLCAVGNLNPSKRDKALTNAQKDVSNHRKIEGSLSIGPT